MQVVLKTMVENVNSGCLYVYLCNFTCCGCSLDIDKRSENKGSSLLTKQASGGKEEGEKNCLLIPEIMAAGNSAAHLMASRPPDLHLPVQVSLVEYRVQADKAKIVSKLVCLRQKHGNGHLCIDPY